MLILGSVPSSSAQVHYLGNGSPWNQKAETGPDAVVAGWYYNLGITGIRVELVADKPKYLLVKYVFPGSPADGKIAPGDLIVGVNNQLFNTEHKNGYGMDKFGADGPVFAYYVIIIIQRRNYVDLPQQMRDYCGFKML